MIWVMDWQHCWHLRARFIAVAKPAVIVAITGCAAIGLPALLRGPEPAAILPPSHREVMLPPGAFSRPSFDRGDELISPAIFTEPQRLDAEPIVLFPPGGPAIPVLDFAPQDVDAPGGLAVVPALVVVAMLRRRG